MKCKYQVRCFSSKGALLVLCWSLLATFGAVSSYFSYINHFDKELKISASPWLMSIPPLTMVLVSAPLFGWLADVKFGYYKVLRFGIVMLFTSTVMNCSFLVLEALVADTAYIVIWIHYSSNSSLFVIGACACVTSLLPIGLDQMPDASSANVASYVAWFVFCVFIGYFLGDGLDTATRACLDEIMLLKYYLILAFFSTLCFSLVLISNFLYQSKLLLIAPKATRSLETIYQVIKFAVKHKAPLNRSALTYWEKDIPSRIDLGKSKYGGPFTTEQVEDVKTVLRLLVITILIFLSCLIMILTLIPQKHEDAFPGLDYCITRVLTSFTVSSPWCVVGFIAYEFIVYPLFGTKLPSTLRRIGAVFFVVTLVSFVCFLLKLIHYSLLPDEFVIEWIVFILKELTNGLLFQIVLASALEFWCAQSPYNMRGLMLSLVSNTILMSAVAARVFISVLPTDNDCLHSWYYPVLSSAKTLLCLIGFILYCVVARWYKLRVRDEEYFPQQVIEEVYDRYLTAAAAQPNAYGAVR